MAAPEILKKLPGAPLATDVVLIDHGHPSQGQGIFRKFPVVDVQGQTTSPVWPRNERVDEVDIDLRLKQRGQDRQETLFAVHLHAEHLTLVIGVAVAP